MEKRNLDKMTAIGEVGREPADPVMCARVDGLIEQFRVRGIRMTALNIIGALTDAGLHADAAKILAETVLARIGQRVAPLDDRPSQFSWGCVAPFGQQAILSKPVRTMR